MRRRGTTLRVRFVNDDWRKHKWGVFWNVYQAGHTGRPKQKSEWFATEAEAQEFRRLTLEALAANTPLEAIVTPTHRHADSLAVLAQDWLAEVKLAREAATHRNYVHVTKHYLAPEKGHHRYPGLGNLVVSDQTLTTKVIVDYLRALHAAGVTLSMRRRAQRALSALCTYARFAGRLTGVNPCSQVGRMIRQRGEAVQEPVPNPFTVDEIVRFFDHLTATEGLAAQVYCQFQYDVGTRPGEAGALPWEKVDLDRYRAHIAYSYDPVAQADKDTKTHETRWVDLTDAVVALLRQWRTVQLEETLRRGLPRPKYVFTSLRVSHKHRELARYTQDSHIATIFTRVAVACAITGHTLYDLRDSFATSHLVSNWDRKIAWVSKQLGHKTPMTTAKHYYAFRDTQETRGFANSIRTWDGR